MAFLLITTFLWVLRALNDRSTAVFEVQTQYSDLPQSYGLTSETPTSFKLKVTGTARDLRKSKKLFKDGLELSGKQIVETGDKQFLPPTYIESVVAKKLPQDVQLLEIMSDTLFLKLKKLASKKVPVLRNIDVSYAPMHDSFGQSKTEPDSVIISGSENLIQQIDNVQTRAIELKNVSDTVRKSIELQTQTGISLFPKNVKLMIPVERFTEKSIELAPTIQNLPDTVNFISFPKTAQITFRVGLSNYEKVTASDFSLRADFEKIAADKPSHFTPIAAKFPDYIKNVNVSPQSFEYFIEVTKDNDEEE
jgi:YbbR domain-containing protein